MKTTHVLLASAGILLSANCQSGVRPTSDQQGSEELATVVNDSVVYASEDSILTCYIRADVPPEGATRLSVCEWFDESLGGHFAGDVTDVQAVADYYGRYIADSLRREHEGLPHDVKLAYEAHMTRLCETSLMVTYQLQLYIYLGGAHPSSYYEGLTFRKSDGRRLNWDILRSDNGQTILEPMLRGELRKYFEVATDEELLERLTLYNPYMLPLPVTPPCFTPEGLAFTYQQYEIAPYAAGMPSGVIPYDRLRPALAQWALRLIK